MERPPITEILAGYMPGRTGRLTRQSRFDPETAKARRLELTQRATYARRMADEALRRLHADEYDELTIEARAAIDGQRGPLPGDEEEA